MSEVLPEMTPEKALVHRVIVDDRDHIFNTDGDLRRRAGDDILTLRADQVMTPGPKTIRPTGIGQ